jgi:TonB family protein
MTTGLAAVLLLSLAVKSTIILAGAALAAKVCGRASASTRHTLWAAALAGVLLLPLMTIATPGWRPPLPAGLAAVPAQAVTVLEVVASPPGMNLSAAALAWWIWATGLALILVHTAAGLMKVQRLVQRASRLEGRGAGIYLSAETPVPVVCGFWRERVILPEGALSWPTSRLRMVLTHERMHIARHDTRTYLMGRLACALYWPNPLVWWAANCLRREAEHACDDGVLIQGERAAVYADALVQVVQALRNADRLPEGGLAMGRVSELEIRLRALLNSGLSRRKATPLLIAGVSLLSFVILLPLAAFQTSARPGSAIAGVVRDASGAFVPKARVTILLTGSERKEFALTGEGGEFLFQPLPEGAYSVTVEKQGFARLRLEGIVVKTGEVAQVQPVLNVGQVSETVDVKAERPTAEATAPGAPQRIRTGGNVQASKMVDIVRPVYPPDCKAEGVEGTVLLRAVIGVDGGILNLQQINQLVDARLAAAATEAVRQWRYQPTWLNGTPVEVITEIQVNFSLAK